MSTLVDPRICPDCRAPLSPDSVCTGCGLRLTGPAAVELWQVMSRADALISELRREADEPSPTGPTSQTSRPAPAGPPPFPTSYPAPAAAPVRRLPALSVPVVLLGLGALCVLVAAIVFVAVTWSSLGLGAKATILLGVTAGFTAAAAVLTRRGLRGAAETFWIIVAVLLTVDIAAAYGADLAGLGDVPGRHVVALTGAVLLLLAIGAGAWATTTPTRRLYGLVAVAGGGTLLLTSAEAYAADRPALAVAVAVALIVALALALAGSAPMRPTAIAVGANAVLAWLVLVGIGLDRSAGPGTETSTWWAELRGWPLLVAAGYAAVLALLSRLPNAVRMAGAAGTLLVLGAFVLAGTTDATPSLVAAAGVAAGFAAVSAGAGRIWSAPAAVLSFGALALSGLFALARPWDAISGLPTTGPADEANLDLRLPGVSTDLAPWTAIVVAVVLLLSAVGLLRHLPEAFRAPARTAVLALTAPVVALGATTALLERAVPLLPAVLCWAAVLALAGGAVVLVREHAASLLGALGLLAYLSVLGLRLAVPSHLLAAALATALAIGLGAAYARARVDRVHGYLLPLLAGGSVLAAGFAALHWPYVAGGAGNAAGACVAALAAVALLAAHPAGRTEGSRRTGEVIALGLGLAATLVTTTTEADAVVLTVLGGAVALVAVLHRDRDLLGWGAVALLAIATTLRLAADVEAPELYTIPIAVLLLAGGVRRLLSDPAMSTVRALSGGLVLGLAPSLLLALDEPVSLRGALIAAAGVGVLGAGVRARWAAPFLAGAATVAVLALRHLGPVAEGLPRWVSLGGAGLLFLLVGITWEARRRDLARADRYLASLR